MSNYIDYIVLYFKSIISEMYLEPIWTFTMEFIAKIVNR